MTEPKSFELELYKAQEELNERVKDPFDFCYLLFEWQLYPWQYKYMGDGARLIVLRNSRQCLFEDTEIVGRLGRRTKIKDIKCGSSIWSMNNDSLRIEPDAVKTQWDSGKKIVYKIKTISGKEIICSAKHPLFIKRGRVDKFHDLIGNNLWTSIEKGLYKKDRIAVPDYVGEFGLINDPKLAKLLGYMCSDGGGGKGTKQSFKFTNTNKDYLSEFCDLLKSYGQKFKMYPKGNGFDVLITDGKEGQNRNHPDGPVRALLKQHYCTDHLPDIIYNFNKECTALFINRLYSGDGWVTSKKIKKKSRDILYDSTMLEVGIGQPSQKFLQDLQQLLLKFGVHSYINEIKNAPKQKNKFYKLRVGKIIDVQRFMRDINVFGKNKTIYPKKSNTSIESGTRFDPIKSIEKIGMRTTYDIETKENHNFVANNMIVHNSGKTTTCALRALFDCYHTPNYSVICLSPSLRQSGILFDKCRDFINSSRFLKSKVVRETRTLLEFSNGSIIRSLPTGIDGKAVRGYTANCIICDESQAINEKVFIAIEPILATTQGRLILLGTPNRMSGKFFYASTVHNNEWSKYHITYRDSPLITDKFIQSQRKQMTVEAFRQEYLAEFCEDKYSFFPPELFYGDEEVYFGCLEDYSILNELDIDVEYYCGVDFAKTQDKFVIAILQRAKPSQQNNWAPVAKLAHLEVSEHTDYVKQAMRIISLHNKYNFKTLLVDATGLGSVMHELIQKQVSKAKGFNFNVKSKPDIYAKMKISFENQLVVLPSNRKEIIDEFTNIHKEETAAGNLKLYPSNKAIHDDIVDALSLANLGMIGNKGSSSRVRSVLK